MYVRYEDWSVQIDRCKEIISIEIACINSPDVSSIRICPIFSRNILHWIFVFLFSWSILRPMQTNVSYIMKYSILDSFDDLVLRSLYILFLFGLKRYRNT